VNHRVQALQNQHSGDFPCIFPCIREIRSQTSSHETPCTANLNLLIYNINLRFEGETKFALLSAA
jgi:hypothetical protein